MNTIKNSLLALVGVTLFGFASLANAIVITMDNADAGGVAITGPWVASTGGGVPTFIGANYLWENSSTATDNVEFTPSASSSPGFTPGKWALELFYVGNTDREAAVQVDILTTSGLSTIFIDQTTANLVGTSTALGMFMLDNTSTVKVYAGTTAGKYVSVDALQLTSVPAPMPEPASIALLGLGLAGIGFRAGKKKTT